MKRRSKFSAEFKQEAVALVTRSGKGANRIAKELGISQTSLSRWVREAARSSKDKNGFATQEKLTRLGKKVKQLRMERDILCMVRTLVHHETYHTRDQAKPSVFEYIEVFYNHHRKHSGINYLLEPQQVLVVIDILSQP